MFTRKLIYWILALCYFGIGIFIGYTEIVQSPWHIIFALACIGMGILRAFRAMKLKDSL
ncbi:MAG: hypothetical protein IPM92_01840 [Saprospiraceae bacterium]|nr:hypothetical protein [Saprospiraceae bacterium]